MKLLFEIDDNKIFGKKYNIYKRKCLFRKASRAIVFDKENKVGLMYLSKRKLYKITGGGLEYGEDIITALKREVMEEAGVKIGEVKDLGFITEFRYYPEDKNGIFQISYNFIAKVEGEKGESNFQGCEVENEAKTVWVDLDEAIELMKNMPAVDYSAGFIKYRDHKILIAVKDILK